MAFVTRFLLYLVLILLLITGCSGKGNPSAPDTLDDPTEPLNLTETRELTEYSGSHFPLFHNLIYMDVTDPGNVEYEIVPLREGFMHLNILKFLEVSPCTDCFKIVGFSYPEPGVINVDFKITHPYNDPHYTIFDVRGIMMFNGSHTFSSSGLTISDSKYGDGEFLNPDGFTSLYNTWSVGAPAPDIRKYFEGVYATAKMPDSLVNGYIRHISDDPANTRNALLTGDSVTRTYSLKYPADEFVFGYAVDASWAVPVNTPIDNPMIDFGLNANSPEPWKIEIVPFSEGLTDEGGTSWLQIDVYDWQGNVTNNDPLVECPELFDGEKVAGFIQGNADFSRYHVAVSNKNLASSGFYKCLISVHDLEYNPNFPWIDMKAYQVVDIRVMGHPIAIVDADPNPQAINEPVYFWSYLSYDPDGGEIVLHEWDWNNDGIYDETGPEVMHSFSTGGYHHVQCRVTDDEGQTDILDEPLHVLITGPGVPISPVNITPELLNFTPCGVYMEGNLAYITAWPSSLNIYDLSDPYNPVRLVRLDLPGISDRLVITDGYAYVAYNYPAPERLVIVDVNPPGQAAIVNDIDLYDKINAIHVRDGFIYVGQYRYFRILKANPPEMASIIKKFDMSSWAYATYTPWGFPYWHYGWNSVRSFTLSGDLAFVEDTGSQMFVYNISNPDHPYKVNEFSYPIRHIDSYNENLIFQTYGPDALGIFNYNGTTFDMLNNVLLPYSSWSGLWIDTAGIAGLYRRSDVYLMDIDPVNDLNIVSELESSGGIFHGAEGLACMVKDDSIKVLDYDPPELSFYTSEFDYRGECKAVERYEEYVYILTTSCIEIFDVEPLSNASKINEITFNGTIAGFEISDGYLFVAEGGGIYNFHIIDIHSPEDLSIIYTFGIPGSPGSICVEDGYAYSTNYKEGLTIIDIDPIESAHVVNIVIPVTWIFPTEVEVDGGYAYVTTTYFTPCFIDIIDVDPPESAHVIGSVEIDSGYKMQCKLEIQDNYLFAVPQYKDYHNQGYLHIFNLDSHEAPVLVNSLVIPKEARNILVSGNYAYVTIEDSFIAVDISSPDNAQIMSVSSTECDANDAAIYGEFLYVPTDCGLHIFDLW